MKTVLSRISALAIVLLTVLSCDIIDDIPYPTVVADIESFEVEGMCDEEGKALSSAVRPDKSKREITLYVCDTVDISKLKITRFEVTNDATINTDSTYCFNYSRFPKRGFEQVTSAMDTRMDFSKVRFFTLHTYQDYTWNVSIQQVINREVSVTNQIGNATIDPVNRNVIIYVSKNQSLRTIHVDKFSIGGEHGKVSPDPTAFDTYDFNTQPVLFDVTYGWSRLAEKWQVFVYQKEEAIETTAEAFARTLGATISGTAENNSVLAIEYRKQGQTAWQTLPADAIKITGTKYVAELTGLEPGSTYEYKVTANGNAIDVKTLTTTAAVPLENGGFDEWHTDAKQDSLWNPWGSNSRAFWGTGNKGAILSKKSITKPDDDTSTGTGYSAALFSRKIMGILAAGNIFTGEFLEIDGTNGILGFGREFSAFPTKLQFDFKYHTSPITLGGSNWSPAYADYISRNLYNGLKGQPDSCNVYITLLDDYSGTEDRVANTHNGVAYPYLIRTNPNKLKLFNMHDKRIIAYAGMTYGENVNDWKTVTLTLDYRDKNRTPKYILVVASASKYGDYFTGGESTYMLLDNMKLIYE